MWDGTHLEHLDMSSLSVTQMDVHRSPSGHVCDTDIENMIVTLRHERNKNAALMAALKEMEKQQVGPNLTYQFRVTLEIAIPKHSKPSNTSVASLAYA